MQLYPRIHRYSMYWIHDKQSTPNRACFPPKEYLHPTNSTPRPAVPLLIPIAFGFQENIKHFKISLDTLIAVGVCIMKSTLSSSAPYRRRAVKEYSSTLSGQKLIPWNLQYIVLVQNWVSSSSPILQINEVSGELCIHRISFTSFQSKFGTFLSCFQHLSKTTHAIPSLWRIESCK